MLQNEQIQKAWNEILLSLKDKDDFTKANIIEEFLKSDKSSTITSGNLIEMINQAGVQDNPIKSSIICSFLRSSPQSSTITSGNVIEMINQTRIQENSLKSSIIQDFLKFSKLPAITSGNVIEMINQTGIGNIEIKASIIEEFIKLLKLSIINSDNVIERINEERIIITIDNVIEMIDKTGIDNNLYKNSIIKNFFQSGKSSEVTIDNVIKIIKEGGIQDDQTKSFIIYDFLELTESSVNITPQDSARMIKGVDLQYRADLSIKIFNKKFSASENYIENFINFTKELHSNEVVQCEFVKEFIKENKINQNNVMGLKPFIEGLQDNELAIDLIENLYRKRLLKDEKDILSLVKNRSKKQYAFLTEIVGDKDLNDCITQEGITTLKTIFGEESITISDLISYYDIRDQTASLSAILKPEFKKQLRDNFAPSAKMLIYKPVELEKLNSLLSEEGTVFDVKSYLVENAKLCDYLKEKVGDVEEIQSSKTYKINFGNFGIEEEKQAEINDLFNELLKSDNPNQEEVAKFFIDLLQIELPEGENKKYRLAVFFKDNKKEIVHCFCNFNLKKEDFSSVLTSLQDGCHANIDMQFKNMLYSIMIKDEEAQILCAVAGTHIFSAIANNGQDITHSGSSINNSVIKSYSLSPMVLIKKLSKEETMTNKKTWEIIGKIAGDRKAEISERLFEAYTDPLEFDKEAKKIASYLIVKEIVGEGKIKDLESKNLQLKALGDLIYGRTPETSPSSISVDLSGPGHER